MPIPASRREGCKSGLMQETGQEKALEGAGNWVYLEFWGCGYAFLAAKRTKAQS